MTSAVLRAFRLVLVLAIAGGLYLGVYRPLQLRWGATSAETARAMPGDELADRPIFNATRAITIDAPPAVIWPWILQIGYKRAGWYSNLDWLDNAGTPSAERVVPELQHLAVGDTLPIWEGIAQDVVALAPNRSLLTASPRANPDTWLWALVPLDPGHTRLIWRMRNARYDWTSPFISAQLATDLGDFVVVRNVLLGIKERAEGRPIGSLAVGTADVLVWLGAFGLFLASLIALVFRRDWLRPLLAVAATATVTLLLVLLMAPLWLSVLALAALVASLWWLQRSGRQSGGTA